MPAGYSQGSQEGSKEVSSETDKHSSARYPGSAIRTIAMMPARIGSGRLSQRSTSNAKSGDSSLKSAKQNAEFFSSDS
jgi:hypothetical protein